MTGKHTHVGNESLQGEGFNILPDGNVSFDNCSFRRIEKIKPPWHKKLSLWFLRLFYSQKRADADLSKMLENRLRGITDNIHLVPPRGPVFWASERYSIKSGSYFMNTIPTQRFVSHMASFIST